MKPPLQQNLKQKQLIMLLHSGYGKTRLVLMILSSDITTYTIRMLNGTTHIRNELLILMLKYGCTAVHSPFLYVQIRQMQYGELSRITTPCLRIALELVKPLKWPVLQWNYDVWDYAISL